MSANLTTNFFKKPTLTVAQNLLGQRLVFYKHSGIITEVESYIGENDPACHAFVGKTKRTKTMYKKAGTVYVYLIYGIHHCLNIVTEQEGFPSAILIRSLVMEDGTKLDGPGKICKHLGITREHNGLDITLNNNFCVKATNLTPSFTKTPRIGISKGKDKLWRCIVKDEL